jgi:hypothetical protein
MDAAEGLKERVEARVQLLKAKLGELTAKGNVEATDARVSVQSKLDEIQESIKDGWDNLNDAAKARVNRWLDS